MWPKKACIVKILPITDTDSIRTDPEVTAFIDTAAEKLGRKGRFVIRLSGIPSENRLLVEGLSKRHCRQCIEAFEKLLIGKGYMDHEHTWEVLRETDYGEMDYSSYGGGVQHFVVTLYRCPLCGALHKECRGDFCGDQAEYLRITDDDIALAECAAASLR